MPTSEGEASVARAAAATATAASAAAPAASESVLDRVAAVMRSFASTPTLTQIGNYRLHEIIGEGGMGVVFRAEQLTPIRRTVALKLIRPGMAGREVLARFQSERQTLALMNHPNVARVLDAGTSDEGRPYFVMEHVPGEPITTFCDAHRLSIRQRLELFIQACHGVQHAHQKAILHRDLKPSNILVMRQDDEPPYVKVIDFGVAKALEDGVTDRTLHTESGQMIGTPEYMSPEQARSDGNGDVDTRSDIYSLGVVLYELLTGVLPFDPRKLRSSGLAGIERTLRDVDPPRPGMRVSKLSADEAREVAARRQTQVSELSRQLRGELEWIPLKAMRKESAHRYATAAEFAKDIENYLTLRPLIAGPESAAYRLQKFIRRNQAALTVTALLTMVLAGGTALYVRGVRAAQAKTLAALGEAQRQRDRAERSAQETAKVAEFQGRMLANVDVPAMARHLREDVVAESVRSWQRSGLTVDEITARRAHLDALLADANFANPAVQSLDRNIFDHSVVAIEKEFNDQPLVKARLLQQIARTLRNLMLLDRALAPQTEALALRRRELGDQHLETLESLFEMGWLLRYMQDWSGAEACARELISDGGRSIAGADGRSKLRGLALLAEVCQWQGRLREAEEHHRKALGHARDVLPADDPETLEATLRLGQVLLWRRNLAEAEPLLEQAVQRMSDVLGADHWQTMRAVPILGSLRSAQGRFGEAEAHYRRALAWARAARGDEHRDSLFVLVFLGNVLCKQGKFDEAEVHLQNAAQAFGRLEGVEHHDALLAAEGLAMLRQAQGSLAEAERRFADLYQRAARANIAPNVAAHFMSGHGMCLVAMSRYAEAEVPLLEAYRRLTETEQDRHERMRAVIAALVEVCAHTGRPEQAGQWRAELRRLHAATQPSPSAQ